jgi:hypothetical protein
MTHHLKLYKQVEDENIIQICFHIITIHNKFDLTISNSFKEKIHSFSPFFLNTENLYVNKFLHFQGNPNYKETRVIDYGVACSL